MGTDRFGNALADALPYARGAILGGTADDHAKLRRAWRTGVTAMRGQILPRQSSNVYAAGSLSRPVARTCR